VTGSSVIERNKLHLGKALVKYFSKLSTCDLGKGVNQLFNFALSAMVRHFSMGVGKMGQGPIGFRD